MIFKKLFFIILLFLTTNLYSQFQSIEYRKSVIDSIIIIKNDNSLIPLQRLDTLKILMISVNNSIDSSFINSSERYSSINFVDENKFFISKNEYIKKYNLFIIVSDTIPSIDLLSLVSNKKTILCSFASDNFFIDNIFAEKFDCIIISPINDCISKDLTAQIVFGGLACKNKLKYDLNTDFRKNYGFETNQIRLKYTIPEEIGLDSSIIYQKIDSIVNKGIIQNAFPGCQILIAKDMNVFFQKSYGYQTYDSIVKVNNSTIYDLASLTKITAPLPCLMKLYDEKEFSIDEKFSKYYKPFKRSDKKDIIVKDVLTHQAGLKAWIPFWKNMIDENGEYRRKTIKSIPSKKYLIKISENKYLYNNYYKKVFKEIKNSELDTAKKYVYSDLSFYLYPKIIEKITKSNYEEYLYSNFYDILGCSSMKYNPLKYFSKEMIAPTENDIYFRKEQIYGTVHDEGAILLNGISGHAGMFANANDLAKLMQMYLNYGEYGNYRFISDTTLKIFTKYQFPELNNRRGLGFDKPSISDKRYDTPCPDASDLSFGHTGFTGTFAWVDPKNGLLIIFLSNRVYPTRENKNLMRLNIRTSIHQVIYDELKKLEN